MKRRKFAQPFNPDTRQRQRDNRVQVLPETTQDFVRSGQIIGSPYRAIEELVRNSIIHGGANEVIITIGTAKRHTGGGISTFMEVKDDGIGINDVSCRDFIGTQYCSSQAFQNGSRSNHIVRGESLKALAALSVEFRVETTCAEQRKPHEQNFMTRSARGLLSAPSKPRRSPSYVNTSLRQNEEIMSSSMISSEKIVRDGKTLAFRSTHNASSKRTGTKVQLYGLFHKHEVRLIHHQMKSSSSSSNSSDQFNIGQARTTVQMLALAFPNVSLKLLHTRSTEPIVIWLRPAFFDDGDVCRDFPLQLLIQRATKQRFLQLCETRELIDVLMVDVSYGEGSHKEHTVGSTSSNLDCTRSARKADQPQFRNSHTRSKVKKSKDRIRSTHSGREHWSISGVLLRKQNNVQATEADRHRNRQQELIYVNKRLAKNHTSLADMVQKLCGMYAPGDHVWRFLLRISCPPQDADLVLDEIKSYSLVRQKDRLTLALSNAILAALRDHAVGSKRDEFNASHTINNTRKDIAKREKVPISKQFNHTAESNVLNRSSRIVRGKEKKHGHSTVHKEDESVVAKERIASSPFSDAFSHTDKRQNANVAIRSPHFDSAFDDAFMSNDKPKLRNSVPALDLSMPQAKINTIKDSSQTGMIWTRKRLKVFDSEMKSLTTSNGICRPIKLSRDMLSRAQFIAQLDTKFIIVNMDGILCAIDQHAADERVGLERLEDALESNTLLHSSGRNQTFFDLSKMKNISANDTFKTIPLEHAKPIPLSSSQATSIAENETHLRKWKFEFEIDKTNSDLYLNAVPGICDKVATIKDFIQFAQSLGNHTSDASLVKPLFVKRVLASYACRYAIMFGDILDNERCKELIASLAECDLSFICAHGRPSIVPLIDMNTSLVEGMVAPRLGKSKQIVYDVNQNGYIPLRFRGRKK